MKILEALLYLRCECDRNMYLMWWARSRSEDARVSQRNQFNMEKQSSIVTSVFEIEILRHCTHLQWYNRVGLDTHHQETTGFLIKTSITAEQTEAGRPERFYEQTSSSASLSRCWFNYTLIISPAQSQFTPLPDLHMKIKPSIMDSSSSGSLRLNHQQVGDFSSAKLLWGYWWRKIPRRI